jgi:two-component system cell cycle response regulator
MPKSTLLIVDDDPIARNIHRTILMKSEHGQDYEIEVAVSGKEALEKATQVAPDLILLDVMMPDMDGFDVCRALRANPHLAEVPIVMVTALEDQDSRLQGIHAGADDFITKPVNAAELIARVQSITRLNRYRRLHAERARFEWVVSQTDDGYLLVDNQDTILYANRKARIYLGLESQDGEDGTALGLFLDLAGRYYRFEPEEAWKDWPSGEEALHYLVRPETATARAFWLQVSRLEQTVGLNTYRLILLKDVTQQMSVERDMHTFKSAIAHKLRTPLTAIVSSVTALKEDIPHLEADEMELVDVLADSITHLKSELEEILMYLEAPLVVRAGEREGLSLVRLQEWADEFREQFDLSGLDVECQEGEEGTRITLSPKTVEWILWELLDNASKFHPQGKPRVLIQATRPTPDVVRLSVIDDGIHLSPEQLASVWTPYYQAEKDFTGNVLGMGLGLSTVASLVWEAGGRCRLYNRPDRPGVIVALDLPVQPAGGA